MRRILVRPIMLGFTVSLVLLAIGLWPYIPTRQYLYHHNGEEKGMGVNSEKDSRPLFPPGYFLFPKG